jgi:hypothetical protein
MCAIDHTLQFYLAFNENTLTIKIAKLKTIHKNKEKKTLIILVDTRDKGNICTSKKV